MKGVLKITVLFVLFCFSIFSENEKDIIKILLKYNDSEIVYYYEFSYNEENISLFVYREE